MGREKKFEKRGETSGKESNGRDCGVGFAQGWGDDGGKGQQTKRNKPAARTKRLTDSGGD